MKAKSSILSNEFPVKLKRLRQQSGWSQGQLAQKIDADTRRISKYERGLVFPTTEVVLKMAIAFGVSTDYLLRNDNDEEINGIKNQKLLKRIKKIDELSEQDQNLLIQLLDVFIKQKKVEELIHNEV